MRRSVITMRASPSVNYVKDLFICEIIKNRKGEKYFWTGWNTYNNPLVESIIWNELNGLLLKKKECFSEGAEPANASGSVRATAGDREGQLRKESRRGNEMESLPYLTSEKERKIARLPADVPLWAAGHLIRTRAGGRRQEAGGAALQHATPEHACPQPCTLHPATVAFFQTQTDTFSKLPKHIFNQTVKLFL